MIKEEDIRPEKLFDEYLSLAERDAIDFFTGVERNKIGCIACGQPGEKAFIKQGFQYDLCSYCSTLFVSPRPVNDAFRKFYAEAPSSNFYATSFYPITAASRKELLWKPKAKKIAAMIEELVEGYCPNVVDIGGGYGLFAEVIVQELKCRPVIIEPAPHLAKICINKGLPVIEKFIEDVKKDDLPTGRNVFVSFELFEHLHDPKGFLEGLASVMNSGDVFIFTTLSGTGLDIQLLWESSKSVTPPHHLNFVNPFAVKILLERCDFKLLNVSTPGQLDVDIVLNNKDLIKDRFWKTFASYSSEAAKERMQAAISENLLSSHMMVVCQK